MRVLVVEDDPSLLRAIGQSLREESYAVDLAADGEEGLFKASGGGYDCIVLDLMLPRLDGWQLLERLRPVRATPVLILTARDSVRDRVRGLDGGADDYLVKPFDLAELKARVRALIRRAAGQAAPNIQVGKLTINLKARLVTCGGQEISLTAREYALLELLALRRGEVVSRWAIYEHIFDEREDLQSNPLDVHVSNIRKKLGKDVIMTRRGQGYMIDG